MAGLPSLDAVVEALASPLGAIAFVPLYALWVTLLLPGVWASMLAGALYGTAWGSVVVFVGACLGAEVHPAAVNGRAGKDQQQDADQLDKNIKKIQRG